MMIRRRVAAAVGFAAPLLLLDMPSSRAVDEPRVHGITTLRTPGGQVDWWRDLIAYDAPGPHGRYDVHLMAPDGSADRCLTCDEPRLPRGHKGGACWHPEGRYVVFVAEKDRHPGISYESLPGFGQYCDLWAMTPDGERVFRLTELPAERGEGVLMPHFSPDGRRLSWTQMRARPRLLSRSQTLGYWTLRTARFEETGGAPRLEDVRTYEPSPAAFYENDGFTPDGRALAFTGNPQGGSVWQSQVYTLDLSTGRIASKLSDTFYNEHAVYSPDGGRILWVTNAGNGTNGATDWWVMDADGSRKQRLTFFNQKGHPHYRGKVWATDASWSPDGRSFVGYIQESLLTQKGEIVRVTLE